MSLGAASVAAKLHSQQVRGAIGAAHRLSGALRAATPNLVPNVTIAVAQASSGALPLDIAIDRKIAATQASVFYRDNTRDLDFERRQSAIQAALFFRDTSRDLAFMARLVAIQIGRG